MYEGIIEAFFPALFLLLPCPREMGPAILLMSMFMFFKRLVSKRGRRKSKGDVQRPLISKNTITPLHMEKRAPV